MFKVISSIRNDLYGHVRLIVMTVFSSSMSLLKSLVIMLTVPLNQVIVILLPSF